MFERTFDPFIIAAEVSSHEDSIPKTIKSLTI